MSNGLSQEEINALLEGNISDEQLNGESSNRSNIILTDIEKDILGEVGNISMGSASTALSDMIGKRVNITTPTISTTTLKEMRESFELPNIALEIKYVAGIAGKNILIMRVRDAAIVANIMMGGEGQVTSDELSEIEESAVSEAMNQMMGSAATAMATMFSRKVDISPPKSKIWDSMTSNMSENIEEEEEVVQVAFRLHIENLLDSVIMQVLSGETVKQIASIMMGTEAPCESPSNDIVIESKQDAVEKIKEQAIVMEKQEENSIAGYAEQGTSLEHSIEKVQYKQFSDFDNVSRNTNSILDVPLNIQVVLGDAQRSIKEILNFKNGTLLQLNQMENQPVELQVNGKVIAYGEVVVVDGNLAINITDVNNDNI
ncbi:flagellar motor switch phosphatase FliY [Clostridium sp. CX1]|uniref:Flagellar motor switch phosphatase FliY n=1 Tax=Clostridium tanneri TaxID=3037988 RepID=A0ABU4JR55_9CLOT|nr:MULTISPECIES: flagellar motor switch phosphatase FliY [unclassified Clostridium]MCT8978428.1 flagellar motor switch phosphatase FliY [Clostridium sp. CX1]MDW8800459.1 flagellar motor switch phosphatase FliY [Clostridium sp. A1-XYC3]